MNNNMNKSPVSGKRMNNTIDKKEERRFQEERRDVMKMDKMLAGLIAFVAGVALSAGSAFADTNGYVGGDAAMMKLVPYYETGDTTATIIGVQNMSPTEHVTDLRNKDVEDKKAALKAAQDAATPTSPNLNAIDTAEKALAKAEEAAYKEHVFIDVKVYDAMGMMTGTASLCLKEHQFGYVMLQGPTMQDWQSMDSHQNKLLSVMDDEISADGYAMVMAEGMKYTSCDPASGRGGLTGVLTNPATGENSVTNIAAVDGLAVQNKMYEGASGMVAAWTIIQDTGSGFFGTEVPTSTISMASAPGASVSDLTDDGDPEVACYTTPATADLSANGPAPFTGGLFTTSRCGLIPERHNNLRDTTTGAPAENTTTRAAAYARYDAGDETTVYVWLAANADDPATTLPKNRRMLDVTVMCEDGTMPEGPDRDGDNQPDGIQVAAPGMLTMIDPVGDELGEYTDMCEGDRGVLKIMMPGKSRAGAVFSHITQMMGHYRMNFPGYSMADNTTCSANNLTPTHADYNPNCAD